MGGCGGGEFFEGLAVDFDGVAGQGAHVFEQAPVAADEVVVFVGVAGGFVCGGV